VNAGLAAAALHLPIPPRVRRTQLLPLGFQTCVRTQNHFSITLRPDLRSGSTAVVLGSLSAVLNATETAQPITQGQDGW
jgi:hypothetical protein